MPELTPKWEETQPLQDVPRFEDTQPLDVPSFDQTNDPTVKDEIRAAIPEIVQQIRQAVVAPPQMGEFTQEQMAGVNYQEPTPVLNKFKAMGGAVGGMIESAGGLASAVGTLTQKAYGDNDKIAEFEKSVGQSVTDYGRKMAEFYKIQDPTFADKLAGAAASGVTFILPGAGIMRGAGILAQTPRIAALIASGASGVFEAGLEAGGVYNTMISKGASEGDALSAASKTFAANAALNTGLNYGGGVIQKFMPGTSPGTLRGATLSGVKAAGAEGLQEGTQTAISNVATGEPAMQDVGESAALGSIVGGGMSLGMDVANRQQRPPVPPATQPPAAAPTPSAQPPAAQPATLEGAAPVIEAQKLNQILTQAPKFEETQPAPASLTQSDIREEELSQRVEAAGRGLAERPTAPVEGWKQEAVAGGGTSLESPSGYRVFVPEGQDPQRAAAAIREIERVRDGGSQIPEAPLAKVKKSEAKARYEKVGEVEKKKREDLLSAASKKYEEMRSVEGEDAARKYYDEQDAASFIEFSKARQKAEEDYRKLEALGWEPEAPKPVEPAPVEAPAPIETPEPVPIQKPYWQLTKEEFRQIRYGRNSVKPLTKNMRELHQAEVQGAIARGEAVPPSVLKDYPELSPQTQQEARDSFRRAVDAQLAPKPEPDKDIFTREEIEVSKPQVTRRKSAGGVSGRSVTNISAPGKVLETENWNKFPDTDMLHAHVSGNIDFKTGKVPLRKDPVWTAYSGRPTGKSPKVIRAQVPYNEAVEIAKDYVHYANPNRQAEFEARKSKAIADKEAQISANEAKIERASPSTPAKTAPAKAPLTPIEEAIKSFDFPADSQVNKNLRLYHVVELFKNMEGGVPEVVKTFRRKGGVLGTASSQGKIKLRAALGLNENIAALVLTHELSHVADAIYGDTTKTYARGNILGRIGAMDRYVYDNLAATLKTKEEMTAAQPAVKAIREPFLETVRKEADAQNLKGKVRAQFVKTRLRELSDPNLRAAGFVSQEAVSKELTELARWWNSDKSMKPTGVELYAEGMSVYLLSPKDVAKRAPIFYDLTKNWLQKKPEFEQLVNEFWASLEQSPEIGQDKILDTLTANFQKNRETKAAAEDKVMAAKKDVAPLDWLAMKLNYTIPLTNLMDRLGLQPWDAPFHEIQLWKHHAPITEKYLRDINDSIREAILGTKNLTEDMVGIQLALNRIALGDRSELLNTLGITERSAPEIGARLKERAGEDYDKLLEVVERVYDAHNEILKGADGVLNANGLKRLRDNRYYATFSLNKFIEESVGGNGEISKLIHPQVGSLDAIGSPLEALIDKDVRMQYTFLRSKAFQAFYEWGMKINDGTVKEVERVKGGNIKGAPPGYKTLYWLWDSKVKAMHVKDGFYQIFSQDHSEAARHTNVLESALKFFKYAFVNLNPAFFVTNPIRDSFFTAQNLKELPFFSLDLRYKFGALESLARTMKEIPGAWRHQIGKETSAAIQELKALGVGQSEYNRDMGELSLGLERMLRSNGVFTRTAKFSSPGQALLRAMEIALDAGRASDLASKAAALKLLKEKHPEADPAWLAHILRTRAGTPDTTNRGAMTGVYNWVWMYSQVAFEGWRGNYASAKENPGSFTAKLFGQSVLPRLLVLAAGAGLIGRDDEEKKKLQKIMNGIPEWFKAGSLVIPVGLDKNGKSVFITLPQDELSRTAGGVAYFMVKNMSEASRDSLLKDVMESMKMAVDYGQTQAPGLNPLIQLGFQAGALADLPKGEGPKDSFGRPMISARYRAEYQNQKGRALTEYLKNVWNFAGLTTIYKFKPGAEEVQSELESLLRIPIAGAMASRFIRVSSSGASNKPYEAKAEVEAERATLSNDRIDAMLEFRKNFIDEKGSEPTKRDVIGFYRKFKTESPEAMRGVSVAEFYRSYTNYTVGAKGGAAKALSAFKSGSSQAKAAALREVQKSMSPREFRGFIEQARRDRLISPAVMREFRRLP